MPTRLPGLLAIATLLLLTTCQKVRLPPETQEGKKTFGCKINGRNWVPTGASGGFSGRLPAVNGGFFRVYGGKNTFDLYIRAYKDEDSVELFARNVTQPGTYPLNFLTETMPNAFRPLNYGVVIYGTTEYVTTNKYTGSITVTRADTANKVLSGTFEFMAVHRRDPSRIIHVTKGRFDTKQ
ncbi:MAG: DUF6252 family protein [Cytophagaceae bacterium]|nr:DUF6252 family protein [Cytophagaceae bacterium]